MMRRLPVLLLFVLTSKALADFQQVTEELTQQKIEVQKQIDPLIQQAAELERQSAEAKAQQQLLEQQAKEILTKTEALQNTTKTTLDFHELSEILNVGTVGRCQVSLGKEPNEFYISQDGSSIRVIFASENSSTAPTARFFKHNGSDFIKIEQKSFDPHSPTSKKGVMFADIRLDQNKKIVHAIFKGETIKDKGPFGFFGSSLVPRGLTCVTMEATDSI